jgi:hypothetical protein
MRLLPQFLASFFLLPHLLLGLECVPNFQKNDYPYINEFVNTKRTIPLDEKGNALRFSGDVRVDWLSRREVLLADVLRGGGARDKNGVPIPSDEIAVRFNFRLDYKCKDFYCISHLEWDDLTGIFTRKNDCKKLENVCNAKGDDCEEVEVKCNGNRLFGSGFCNYLCLKRMYCGTTLWKCDKMKWIAEIGRKSLYYTFDSRIQYKARVDGIFSKYSHEYAQYEEGRSSNYFLSAGGFVVDYNSGHYSYAAETGVFNVIDSGFDVKCSIINWRQLSKNGCGISNPLGWRFFNSQVNLDYNFKEKIFSKKFNIYSALLMNFFGKPFNFNITDKDGKIIKEVHVGHENLGWYVGFIIGEVSKAGDFSFDCNYQYVEAQAVPDCDIRGIGIGNARKESFPATRRGNGNFKGLKMELLYAITDLLQADVTAVFSSTIDKKIVGGKHRYTAFEIEFIHAF